MRKNKLRKKIKQNIFFGEEISKIEKRENFNQIANKALDF